MSIKPVWPIGAGVRKSASGVTSFVAGHGNPVTLTVNNLTFKPSEVMVTARTSYDNNYNCHYRNIRWLRKNGGPCQILVNENTLARFTHTVPAGGDVYNAEVGHLFLNDDVMPSALSGYPYISSITILNNGFTVQFADSYNYDIHDIKWEAWE